MNCMNLFLLQVSQLTLVANAKSFFADQKVGLSLNFPFLSSDNVPSVLGPSSLSFLPSTNHLPRYRSRCRSIQLLTSQLFTRPVSFNPASFFFRGTIPDVSSRKQVSLFSSRFVLLSSFPSLSTTSLISFLLFFSPSAAPAYPQTVPLALRSSLSTPSILPSSLSLFPLPSLPLPKQWSQTFSKHLASKHINEWRAFRDNSIYSYSSSTPPPPPSSLLPAGSNSRNSSTTNERLAGIVGDAKTYAEASKAVRVFLDEDFHTFKVREGTRFSNKPKRAEGEIEARCRFA